MVSIHDPRRVREYLERTAVMEHFSCRPEFVLRQYLPGELLASPFRETEAVQFIVEGDVILYDMPAEDAVKGVDSPFYRASLIGEAELVNPGFPSLFVEARTEVFTLALPMAEYREKLLNDNTFLRYVCRMLTEKLSDSTATGHRLPLKEQMMRYLSAIGEGGEIRDIGDLAHRMHVSPRQMTRVLTGLCEEGLLERRRKGLYVVKKI